MALMFDHKSWLIQAVNAAKATAYRPDDIEFMDVWPKAKLPGGAALTYNTSVRAKVKATGEELVFSYNRIENFLADAITFYNYAVRYTIKINIIQKPGETLEQGIARGLARKFGITVTDDDFVPNSARVADDGLSVQWSFSASSYRYTPATVTVGLETQHVLVDGQAIRTVDVARTQPDFFYEDHVDRLALDLSKAINIGVVTAGTDYTPIAKFLNTFRTDSINWNGIWSYAVMTDLPRIAELAVRLKSVDGLPWVATATATAVGAKAINLQNSILLYNGRTEYFKDDRWKLYIATPQYGLVPELTRYLDVVDERYTHVAVMQPNAHNTPIANKSSTREFAVFHYNLEA